MPTPTKIYEASNSVQAHALSNLLFDEGIESQVHEYPSIEMAGGGINGRPELWVGSDDALRARNILLVWEKSCGSARH